MYNVGKATQKNAKLQLRSWRTELFDFKIETALFETTFLTIVFIVIKCHIYSDIKILTTCNVTTEEKQ